MDEIMISELDESAQAEGAEVRGTQQERNTLAPLQAISCKDRDLTPCCLSLIEKCTVLLCLCIFIYIL